MRNTSQWSQRIIKELDSAWSQFAESGMTQLPLSLREICEVELGLTALHHLSPSAPASSVWALLIGYPFPCPERAQWTPEHWQILGNIRHLLAHWKNPYPWRRVLEYYLKLSASLRAYDVDAELNTYEFRGDRLTLCAARMEIYSRTLRGPVPLARGKLKPGPLGKEYLYQQRPRPRSVTVPDDLPALPFLQGHDLSGKRENEPLQIRWADLIETAQEMDRRWQLAEGEEESPGWERILRRIQFQTFDQTLQDFTDTQDFSLDGLQHFAGMVSSGKSTLMEVLAAHLAWRGKHTTLVVSDILNIFERAKRFSRLGIRAAPIIGATSRLQHIERMHRALATRTPNQPLSTVTHQHPAFRWLSSVCMLDALRSEETSKPFRTGREPCRDLQLIDHRERDDEEGDEEVTVVASGDVACPFYAICPRRIVERDLVDAHIWIATPASLIFTGVPNELNAERLRMAELVYRRSHLVVIDEADHAQSQLDSAFSPNQILIGETGESWLDKLATHVESQINGSGRVQLAEPEAAIWYHALRNAITAVNALYSMLQQPDTRPLLKDDWVGYQYFSEWMLFNQLALDLSGAQEESEVAPGRSAKRLYYGQATAEARRNDHYLALMEQFNQFLDDRLGENGGGNHPLVLLARSALSNKDGVRVNAEIEQWLDQQEAVKCSSATRVRSIVRLRFVLLLAILADQLDYLIRCWRQIEGIVDLEKSKGGLSHRPPQDYHAVIPDAPMGNVLGFQFLPAEGGAAGKLRFLRCAGVGRWLMLHLRDLFASDGLVGPHTLLLSGTSWAGTSPHYHVQAPVDGILRMPAAEMHAIDQSQFRFRYFTYENQPSEPVNVSGKQGTARLTALYEILRQLASPARLGGASLLERERDQLPPSRNRVLLLVGSYDEAEKARQYLEQLQPTWKTNEEVKDLIPDNADDDNDEWAPGSARHLEGGLRVIQQKQDTTKSSIVRGQVHRFATDTTAWVLIAPLQAIERGHNILNEHLQAAIGAAYFLVRPHPHPDDLGYTLHTMNRWAVASAQAMLGVESDDDDQEKWEPKAGEVSLAENARDFRAAAYRVWQRLLNLHLIYSRITDHDREALIWSQVVSTWQVVGRLIRGGVPARVYFCDAKFAEESARQSATPDTAATSLLVGMIDVLRPYCGDPSPPERDQMGEEGSPVNGLPRSQRFISPKTRALVRILYGPFYTALLRTRGLNTNAASL